MRYTNDLSTYIYMICDSGAEIVVPYTWLAIGVNRYFRVVLDLYKCSRYYGSSCAQRVTGENDRVGGKLS
jgi:hypothetical protein